MGEKKGAFERAGDVAKSITALQVFWTTVIGGYAGLLALAVGARDWLESLPRDLLQDWALVATAIAPSAIAALVVCRRKLKAARKRTENSLATSWAPASVHWTELDVFERELGAVSSW